MSLSTDIEKQLQDGRRARSERVRAMIEAGTLPVIAAEARTTIGDTTAGYTKRRKSAKRFSQSAVDRICRDIETGIADCRRDMPEVPEHDAAHDIAWSLLHCHLDEHPDTIRAICNRYGIDASVLNLRGTSR